MSVWVLGAGGHGKVVTASLQATRTNVEALLDDNVALHGSQVLGVPVQAGVKALPTGGAAVIAIGDNATRRDVARQVKARWQRVLHPHAWVHPSTPIGEGSVIFAGAVLQPGTDVGRHVVVNTCASIDHDGVLGDFSHIGPGATLGGGVQVDEGAFVGAGAVIVPGVHVGAWATVGAGAVVLGDVPPGATVVGNPARILREATHGR